MINFELASELSEAMKGLNKPLLMLIEWIPCLYFYADERLPLASSVVSNAALPKFYFAPNKELLLSSFVENFKVMKMQL